MNGEEFEVAVLLIAVAALVVVMGMMIVEVWR